MKLAKEEEKAMIRIRDAERKASFVSEMQKMKEDRLRQKQAFMDDLKKKEILMREKINGSRIENKKNIYYNKMSIF